MRAGSPIRVGKAWFCALFCALVGAGGRPAGSAEPRAFEASVVEVNLRFSAFDQAGKPVTDLGLAEIRVSEDGQTEELRDLRTERSGLELVLAVDSSESMRYRMDEARSAALDFVDRLGDDDEALGIDFDDDVRVLGAFSTSRDEIRAGLEKATAGGATLLYDAIATAVSELSHRSGRRVLVLLSDGEDGSLRGGSRHRLPDVLERARREEVEIHAIGVGLAVNRFELEDLAKKTGGSCSLVPDGASLGSIYRKVRTDLTHAYVISYTSHNPSHDGKFRNVEITTTRPGVTLRTRPGFYAPEGEAR